MAQLVTSMSGVVPGGVVMVVGSNLARGKGSNEIDAMSLVSLDPSGFHLRTK